MSTDGTSVNGTRHTPHATRVTFQISRLTLRILLTWLAWAAILLGFQALVAARLAPQRPDYARPWTPGETRATSQNNKPYLLEPFMNAQVSWDSEFYLAIATRGYDDPAVRAIPGPGGRPLSLNYAFFPFYPYVMKAVAAPLHLVGLRPVAASTLAGVLVSLVGTLAGMLALADLAREELEERGGLRAAFYLVAFPMGFFLAQVYTEGLFVGLAFWCLALIRPQPGAQRRGWRLVAAAALAVLATWTRAVGVGLSIPLALAWWDELRKGGSLSSIPWPRLAGGLAALAPLAAYAAWRGSFWGQANAFVEASFFGRGLLLVRQTLLDWRQGLAGAGENPQAAVYYGLELALIALAVVSCLATWRRSPGLSGFGLFVIAVSLTSGAAQSIGRYVVPVPSIYLFLARLGRDEAFDRGWTLASVLVMGLLATLFTFDMWVA